MLTPAAKLALYVIRVVWALLSPLDPRDVEGLRSYAPSHLTLEQAADHFYAARLASAIHHQDVYMVLAIAEHESNFQQHAITKEVGNKRSCGVMTPIPTRSQEECDLHTSSLLAGYLAGAEHVYVWGHAGDVRSTTEALRGVGGGYKLIRACREADRSGDRAPVLRKDPPHDDLCNIADTFRRMRGNLVNSIKLAHRRADT